MAEHDFIQLDTVFFGRVRLTLDKLDLEWPPPEFLVFDGEHIREATAEDKPEDLLQRYTMSKLTDEQMESCPLVARGAAYAYVKPLDMDMGHS